LFISKKKDYCFNVYANNSEIFENNGVITPNNIWQ